MDFSSLSHVIVLFVALCGGSDCKRHTLYAPEKEPFASINDCQARSMPMMAGWYGDPENQLVVNGRHIARFWCMTQEQYQRQARFF